MATKPERDWNLFARELEAVLGAHHQSLSALDAGLGISVEKARRLHQSLLMPGSLPVLGPEELDELELKLPLSPEEWTRLRAALLATGIERMLTYRIGQERALQAAERLLLLLDASLQEQNQQDGKARARRGPDWEAREDTGMDRAWERIWGVLDEAELALQLSYSVPDREGLRMLRAARTDFQAALDQLNALDEGAKSLPIWTDAFQEGRRGLALAEEMLTDLAGSGGAEAR